MPIRCFMLEPTGEQRVSLLRYQLMRYEDGKTLPRETCPSTGDYHYAQTDIGRQSVRWDAERKVWAAPRPADVAHDDPRWPARCACGYAFREDDEWQVFTETLYRRADTGAETTIRDAPAGAMWYADWLLLNPDASGVPGWAGPDGHALMVRTPGGDWMIDGPASNCTMPDDRAQRRHHCWVRHGTPPDVTVDKAGPTCAAGAGSIQAGSYHGFLRDGFLTDG